MIDAVSGDAKSQHAHGRDGGFTTRPVGHHRARTRCRPTNGRRVAGLRRCELIPGWHFPSGSIHHRSAEWASWRTPGSASLIMESEHAPLRVQVPDLREELRDAAPDDGRRSRVGMPGVPVRGGRAPAFGVCHERMRHIRLREVHLSAVDDGRSARRLDDGNSFWRFVPSGTMDQNFIRVGSTPRLEIRHEDTGFETTFVPRFLVYQFPAGARP